HPAAEYGPETIPERGGGTMSRFVAPALAALALFGVGGATLGSAATKPDPGLAVLAKVNHIVVIYEENHSFDNLYGGWEGVNGHPATAVKQVNANGVALN